MICNSINKTIICLVTVLSFQFSNLTAQPIDPDQNAKEQTRQQLEKKANEAQTQKTQNQQILVSNLNPSNIFITVNQVQLKGNKLISTDQIFFDIPSMYNSSDLPLSEAPQESVYDLRAIRDVIRHPGHSTEVSARTIQGLTQSILAMYKALGYSGIYVSPEGFESNNKLKDDVLIIDIIEAPISETKVNYFTSDGNQVEKGYLKSSVLLHWSPAHIGNVARQKQVEEFVNLLNLNPDRYITPVITKAAEPNSLALEYNVYEANPWHWFVQADNSGTKDIKWSPRVGLINSNLTGRDDNLTVVYQAPWEHGIEDRYAVYGKYDFPLWTPRLRLEIFGAYNQFDLNSGGIGFLGNGSLVGSKLKYNLFQENDWFLDLTTSISQQKSKVSSDIFNSILGSKVTMDLWGAGVDIHRQNDKSLTFLSFERIENVGGSDQDDFSQARTDAERDFEIYTAFANHSQFIDKNKIQRISANARYIYSSERLVPAMMTVFGGMYTVRGYKESGIVADEGTLASIQYEFDLVKYEQSKLRQDQEAHKNQFVRRVAPLVFFDYGRAKIIHPVDGETGVEDMYSVGVGALVDLGNNFSGAIYYGFPLEETSTTDTKDGALNLSVMLKW
jgi:hemolysin activation/secretion protein